MRIVLAIINADILTEVLPVLFDLDVYETISELQDDLGNKAVLN